MCKCARNNYLSLYIILCIYFIPHISYSVTVYSVYVFSVESLKILGLLVYIRLNGVVHLV